MEEPKRGGGRPIGSHDKAPRKKMRPDRQAQVIQHIEVAKLVRRLTQHAMGQLDGSSPVKHPMDASQVQAARLLLDKVLSNAPTRNEHSGLDGQPIPTIVNVVFTNNNGTGN